ncbi:hypothetical protein UFOVP1167_17 [uncultured Caudovirales phage]|uniref:Bbp19-like phage domain-containing protein n=1 Tax=uncultured Caudovirales phage TaxID=2100421 RepID=A0A6J5R2L9_9CAUD|nr:hypothetical protein UFOVP1167_17 [uncultured Caudovirales phage]
MARITGPDGRARPHTIERVINQHMAACFGSPSGRAVLDYLKSITINTASGPEVNVNALIHLEGQRFLVGLIQSRIEHGHKENRNAPRSQDPAE